jgi:hypothetical protein
MRAAVVRLTRQVGQAPALFDLQATTLEGDMSIIAPIPEGRQGKFHAGSSRFCLGPRSVPRAGEFRVAILGRAAALGLSAVPGSPIDSAPDNNRKMMDVIPRHTMVCRTVVLAVPVLSRYCIAVSSYPLPAQRPRNHRAFKCPG